VINNKTTETITIKPSGYSMIDSSAKIYISIKKSPSHEKDFSTVVFL